MTSGYHLIMSCKCNSLLKKRSYCLPDILSRDYIYIMKRQEGGPVKDASGKFWQKNENNNGIIIKYFNGELQ